ASSRSSRPMTPRAINGEALTTQSSITTRLGGQLVHRFLEGADAETSERRNEFGAGQSRDLGGAALAYELHLVPLYGRGEPHLPREVRGILPKGGKRALRNLDDDLDHGLTVALDSHYGDQVGPVRLPEDGVAQ